MFKKLLFSSLLFTLCFGCQAQEADKNNSTAKIIKTEKEWKQILTEEEFYVLRKKGTEMAFTGEYNNHHETGVYMCAACDNEVFHSEAKYESGSGWPSFYEPIAEKNIDVITDKSFGISRKEIICSRCDSHLGHVFNDGPKPTGLRYCINSVALDFKSE